MALLYPWATKEYLLWEMTIGQLIMYHNAGIEIKYPAPRKAEGKSLSDMSPEERKEAREAARRMMRESKKADELAANEAAKAPYREKYGAV